MEDKQRQLLEFLEDSIEYFQRKMEGMDRDRYFADRDIRSILDKTINDIIFCMVDIAEECLKKHGRSIPATYKDTMLASHEFLGDVVFAVAPLVKHRNEIVHQYLKINWQNIVTVRNKRDNIKAFADRARSFFA
ncbi:MAG: DUF86 domain-containing protein [Nitrospirae bacterium]|nr:DUF86 domain-containing protein [Nitrospirota bacterium]